MRSFWKNDVLIIKVKCLLNPIFEITIRMLSTLHILFCFNDVKITFNPSYISRYILFSQNIVIYAFYIKCHPISIKTRDSDMLFFLFLYFFQLHWSLSFSFSFSKLPFQFVTRLWNFLSPFTEWTCLFKWKNRKELLESLGVVFFLNPQALKW